MKKILGLDLGTASIGWALVHEAENEQETSEIIKLGVRVNPLSSDEKSDFEKGKSISINADRTLKRGARRSLQRFKLRRENLMEILLRENIIQPTTVLTETGSGSTHQTLKLRSKAASEQISLEEFARVLLAINKKRGYKSSRKAQNDEEGVTIEGMDIAKELYERNITPGQYVLELLEKGKKYIPDFYQSDLRAEFDGIWNFQKQFYPEVFTDDFYKSLEGQGQQNTRKRFLAVHEIYTAENKGKREEKRLQHYQWRAEALAKQLPLSEVAYVLVEINNNLNNSSGYLGAISDRSKELYFNKETVGQYLYRQIQEDFHTPLKNQVFYRQDYLDEFEKIWETQAKFYPKLTQDLKEEIRDVVIFYQRKLKSQKHLISECEFEKHHKVVPKSSPLFQEFKIWQVLNNIQFKNVETKEIREPSQELKEELFEELNIKGDMKSDVILKLAGISKRTWKLNYTEGLPGNTTNKSLYKAYETIAEREGYGFDWTKKSAFDIKEEVNKTFASIGINTDILEFDAEIDGNDFDKQTSYQFWHLLYSSEDDGKISEEDILTYGNTSVALKKILHQKYGFSPEYAKLLANVSFSKDHGNVSAKAIKKILPYLKAGHVYSEACSLAGYRHSLSLTKEELENRPLANRLELVKKNSLRNPVVEKILNQMVNVVNQIIETYGKPDEIRLELARELKKSAKEREETTKYVNAAKRRHDEIREILATEFGIPYPSRNDIIRYKLYQELRQNGYKTLYTDTYIPKEKLFTSEIEIEHIIPKARLFDDSFSNKTLAFSQPNKDKGNRLAFDYVESTFHSDVDHYKARVSTLFKMKEISKAKHDKLLMKESELPDDFIERDLRNSQYIARKSKEILLSSIRRVNTTTGKITDKLREDWGLINVMKELNLPKYRALGMTEIQERRNGKKIEQIVDWTKRNDHRHHAMDALAVAFTTYNHVNYLNHINASRLEKNTDLHAVRNKITEPGSKNGSKKRKFKLPIPDFRSQAKTHLESVLVSFKAKNKVVTKNKNKTKTKGKDRFRVTEQLTPRGQLHKETVYAGRQQSVVKLEKVSSKFDLEKIQQVTKPLHREALLERLEANDNDPKKAFSGKNSLKKNPIILPNGKQLPEEVKVHYLEKIYTIRKPISPENFNNVKSIQKVMDVGVRRILEQRLEDFNGNAKAAFSDLEKYPIWLNKEKGIAIKNVAISGVSNAVVLHSKKDHFGKELKDENGKEIPADFVSTGNNHHVAIYRDQNGKLQDNVVSFYEAVERANQNLPIVDKEYKKSEGWEFLFTMKQNEMFVFPSEDFDPSTVDLMNPENASLISRHLFRVQKFSKVVYGNSAIRDYVFRHHLETEIIDRKELKGTTHMVCKSLPLFDKIKKVRLDHLGRIIHVGEY